MNFKNVKDLVRCLYCDSLLNADLFIDANTDNQLLLYKCNCSWSFAMPYDKENVLDSFIIYLPFGETYDPDRESFMSPDFTFDIDTGLETFKITFHSSDRLNADKSLVLDYIPEFMSLPRDIILEKVKEFLVFI